MTQRRKERKTLPFLVYGVIKLIYLLFYLDIASRFTRKLNVDERKNERSFFGKNIYGAYTSFEAFCLFPEFFKAFFMILVVNSFVANESLKMCVPY